MQNEVHVGDVGTMYRIRVKDKGGDFDPSSASTKQLIFLMPGNITLVKTADVEVGTGDEDGRFFLTYTVGAGDGQSGAEFHATAGQITLQGYLEYVGGNKWHSNKTTHDADGRKLLIHTNLN